MVFVYFPLLLLGLFCDDFLAGEVLALEIGFDAFFGDPLILETSFLTIFIGKELSMAQI